MRRVLCRVIVNECAHLGHARQGWKCRLCKINVHADCRNSVGRCLPKSRLLRRQKSSSELDATQNGQQQAVVLTASNYDQQQSYSYQQALADAELADMLPEGEALGGEEIDQTYVVLKQASELAAVTNCGGNGRRPPALPLVLPPNDQRPSSPNQAEINGRPGVMRISTSTCREQPPPTRRSNPNALSVCEPSSFLASTSGKFVWPSDARRSQFDRQNSDAC